MSKPMLLFFVAGATTILGLVHAGGHGHGHQHVIIHVPYKVKTIHHTHTITKHVHHKDSGGDNYEVLGYTVGHPLDLGGGGGGGGDHGGGDHGFELGHQEINFESGDGHKSGAMSGYEGMMSFEGGHQLHGEFEGGSLGHEDSSSLGGHQEFSAADLSAHQHGNYLGH